MSEPAWKRLGLKVKSVVSHDPLAIATERLAPAPKSKKNDKKQEKNIREIKDSSKTKEKVNTKRKTEDDEKEVKSKKLPKRLKVPKSERKESNVVKDQLNYIRQFTSDRNNWKFSKQKQNWIIKNIKHIPEDYERDMITYLKSVQGGSKDRIVNEMKETVEEWNKMVQEAEEQMKKDLESVENIGEDDKSKKQEEAKFEKQEDEARFTKKEKKKLNQQKQREESKKNIVDYDFAVRAQTVYQALTDEVIKLVGVEDEQASESIVEVSEETVYL